MQNLQAIKVAKSVAPIVVNNATATATSVDTAGFGEAMVLVSLGVTDIALTALKVQESDDDSTYTDISGTVFGTDNNSTGSASTLPVATDDGKNYAFFIKLGGARKRYIKPVITVGNGTTGAALSCQVFLGKGSNLPHNATEQNLTEVINIK